MLLKRLRRVYLLAQQRVADDDPLSQEVIELSTGSSSSSTESPSGNAPSGNAPSGSAPLSKEELAAYIGQTQEPHLAKFITKLRRNTSNNMSLANPLLSEADAEVARQTLREFESQQLARGSIATQTPPSTLHSLVSDPLCRRACHGMRSRT